MPCLGTRVDGRVARRIAWGTALLLLGCDRPPADEPGGAEPEPAASEKRPSVPSPAESSVAGGDAPSEPDPVSPLPSVDRPAQLAERGIVLPKARGGVSAEAAAKRIEIGAPGSGSPPTESSEARLVAAHAEATFEHVAPIVRKIAERHTTAQLLVDDDGTLRAFDIGLLAEASDGGLDLSVTVLEDGYRVTHNGQAPRSPGSAIRPTIPLVKPAASLTDIERWDAAKLATEVDRYARLFTDVKFATLCAEPSIPTAALAAAAQALRGADCHKTTDASCRFPELRLCRSAEAPTP